MSTNPPATQGLARGFYNCPETPEPVDLTVAGHLPAWLAGILYRTGPGTYSIPVKGSDQTYEIRHWFDGLTLHHRFDIQNGKVTYRSRKGAQAYEDYISKVGIGPSETFAQADPCESLLRKCFTRFKRIVDPTPYPSGPSRMNIGVTLSSDFAGFATADQSRPTLVAKTDANRLHYLDPVTLEPGRIAQYSSILPELNGPFTAAHPGLMDGELYNYCLSLGKDAVYKVFRIDASGKGTVLAEIRDAPAAYIHTTFVTERFVVLVVWQSDYKMSVDMILLRDITYKPWSPERKTRFYVIDRKNGGIVKRYQSDPFFAFHCINAFDDLDGSVVLDIACFPNNEILNSLTVANLRKLSLKPSMVYLADNAPRRYKLTGLPSSLPATETSAQCTDALVEFEFGLKDNIELPTTSPHVANKPYQYAYGIHYHKKSEDDLVTSLSNSIIKLDFKSQTSKVWLCKNEVPGEPIFVPKPKGEKEDSGVLLTVVLDGAKGTSALVVLDAETMEEIARAEMTVPVPYGFHGAFTAH